MSDIRGKAVFRKDSVSTLLPIDHLLPELKRAVARNRAVILHAPPSAGKTTRVPLALLEVLPVGRIVMLEPRRIAAVAAANWMARTLNEQAGGTIGYSIRFDSKVSAKTRVEVVTEGILTRRIQNDPGLEGVSLVVFDEFHERSLHADLALALCLDVQKDLRPDLKLLVMSATLDPGPLASLLHTDSVIRSEGRSFPVEERYLEQESGYPAARMAAAIKTAIRSANGDILAFLPGAGEIRSCERALRESLDLTEERLSLHPLYGDLPFEEQERAILPQADRRKIVLATNIAETSLTIEGVHVVIDSGLARRLRFDPSSGMNRLVTVPISRASAEQRKGRAGRLGPGVCYRLYSAEQLKGTPPFTVPEIFESDLSSLALELAAWGVRDRLTLSWLDPPPAAAWESAQRLLMQLGGLDTAGSITGVGREMVRYPLHPRLARLMLRAKELDHPELGADLAAILSERDMFRSSTEKRGREPDVSERVDALRAWRQGREHAGVDRAAVRSLDRTAKQLLRLAGPGRERPGTDEQELIPRLLLAAYPDRVCKRRAEGDRLYVLLNGRAVRLSPDSHLVSSPYLIAVTLDAGAQAEGAVHMASPVPESMIRSECGRLIETVRKMEWDQKEGRVIGSVEERLGLLTLSKKPFAPPDDEAIPILCSAIRAMPGLLCFSAQALQFTARVALLKRAFPEEQWPDLSPAALMARPEEWLAPWLSGIRAAQALQRLDLLPALKAQLTWQQQRTLEERTPTSITVPSGSQVKIDYASGEQPVLAVKLQEMFGLADTPTIAEGRVKLLLHLLSPARRPVQITQDLRGFWNSGYPEVKKDLKGRYPKHPWPEDPWNAVPTKRTKPRM